jgi:hypothetical protein
MPALTFAEKKLLATLTENYAVAPNETLMDCFQRFGKQEFQDVLRIILPHHLVDVSMRMAIRRCIFKQKEKAAQEAYELWCEQDTSKALDAAEGIFL